jgi:predicted metal-dependent hydrolase
MEFTYTIRHTRRRSLGIYVLHDGRVEVRVPLRTPKYVANDYVSANTDWILRRLAQIEPPPPKSRRFEDGATHYLLGDAKTLRLAQGGNWVQLHGNEIHVAARDHDSDTIARLLKEWYRRGAQQILPARLQALAQQFPLAIDPLPSCRIKIQRSRWGSCSSKRNINLNAWLIRLPPECVDLVITHELCHLFELNHGPKFYRLLERALAHWEELEKRLKKHPASVLQD